MRNVTPMKQAAGQNRKHMDALKLERRESERERQSQRRSDRHVKRMQA